MRSSFTVLKDLAKPLRTGDDMALKDYVKITATPLYQMNNNNNNTQ